MDTVKNQIDDLPVSFNDDELRWRTYYAIYRDPFLSRYAPGGGLLWGHRHPFRSRTLMPLGPSRFPGMEPAGDYPIHIIVKEGRITLLRTPAANALPSTSAARGVGLTNSL